MEHQNRDVLTRYISQNLNSVEVEQVEDHIYECDECFNTYMELIENQDVTASTLADDFTDVTMAKIEKQIGSQTKDVSYQSKRNKTIAHYFLAAGLTVVLMVTGVFQGILDFTDSKPLDNDVSITNHLMKKTNNLLDDMKGDFK